MKIYKDAVGQRWIQDKFGVHLLSWTNFFEYMLVGVIDWMIRELDK